MYHPAWREQKDGIKYERALDLAATLPAARRGVTIDLRRDDLSRERVLAGAFRMLDTGSLRVGLRAVRRRARQLRAVDAALRARDRDRRRRRRAAVPGEERAGVGVRHPGPRPRRAGAAAEAARADRPPAGVEGRARVASARRPRRSTRTCGDRTGGEFSAKDFRTLHGTAAAAMSLATHRAARDSRRRRKRAVADAVRAAADELNNTPAIARGSYVDPRLLDAYEGGVTIDPERTGSVESELRSLLGGVAVHEGASAAPEWAGRPGSAQPPGGHHGTRRHRRQGQGRGRRRRRQGEGRRRRRRGRA